MSEMFGAQPERGTKSAFVAGFVSRHDAAAAALVRAFPIEGAEAPFVAVQPGPRPVRPPAGGPRHFSPADPSARPTAGWDPLDPSLQTPHIDPLETAHAAGYAEGLAAAAAVASAEAARDNGLFAGLADSLAGAGRIDREAIARQLRETVLTLTARLVGEIGVSAELLAGRIDAATELLADGAESALLRVHPDDVALLDGRLPGSIFAAGDASVARGSFVLESASTIVEDGPGLWLDQLAQAIDRVPLPDTSHPC